MILSDSLNQIIDTLALLRIVPIKKDHIPYIGSETRKAIKMNKIQLTEAILAKNDHKKWRVYRVQRNKNFKTISKNKSSYIRKNLAKPIDKWKFVKSINSNQPPLSPSHIKINGYLFQSPKLISNIMNDFYINKIKDIRSEFTKPSVDPIKILTSISPPQNNIFKLPFISPVEAKKLIMGQTNLSSTGYDAISNKTLRKIGPEMAPIIAHLINSIIRTGIFPDCLKVSKIIPILKSGKDPTCQDSFRPLNCLPAIEN